MIEERVTPGVSPAITYQEHIRRYEFSLPYALNKTVLDIATGTGYGSYILSNVARSITGVDICEDAINYAKNNYSSPNLIYSLGDAYSIPYPDNYFDVVVSFETIEHLESPIKFLSECKRVLKDDGILIISTPNKDLSEGNNPFHINEFTESEFKVILHDHFFITGIYGQEDIKYLERKIVSFYLELKKLLNLHKPLFFKHGEVWDGRYTPSFPVGNFHNNILKKSAYMIAVCRK